LSAHYLDTSAFIKVVVREAESEALRSYLSTRTNRRVASALLRTEALRAVRWQGPEALAAVREGLLRIDLVGIDDRTLDAAGSLEPRVLRTLDAIHVVTAIAIGDDLDSIVTYDERMIEAARSVGLPVTTPR
jgi:predicted nucleic acid-binding protein